LDRRVVDVFPDERDAAGVEIGLQRLTITAIVAAIDGD
jgi:hypothetical protein